ncbi:hypothetical protein KIW84_056152 [Lathyrus oleraceus]|uniref:D-isomer specific 2-hydroxyacid dehydrogenase NAD-binding domain-containing protein n=1 Tax=Pisum sativum TaxID=3888 RepID=A0A9D4WZR9_PEA|nr:hypothetical protein KIW84_056152 [Pisum sativum]
MDTVSVAEDELMRILILVRNFVPGYHQSITGEWDVAGIAHRAYDLEGKTIGTVGVGRIGKLLLQRLKPFNCKCMNARSTSWSFGLKLAWPLVDLCYYGLLLLLLICDEVNAFMDYFGDDLLCHVLMLL